MPLALRRLLNHLPIIPGGREELYVKPSWHKPTPFDQWKSQAPFRPAYRPADFGRGLRRQRFVRSLVRWGAMFVFAWLVIESVRGLRLL